MTDSEIDSIFSIKDNQEFNNLALKVFRFQYQNNKVYQKYASIILNGEPESVTSIEKIPFLPIKYFKSKDVVCFNYTPQAIFTSSSTTGMVPARHLVKDLSIYQKSFLKGFELFYGDIADYDILALLPSYLQREGSSLVYMAQTLIDKSKASKKYNRTNHSGFYLYNYKDLYNTLVELKNEKRKTILLGVTFALLDFCKEFELSFPDLIIMETGGMKGRGQEVTREYLHDTLFKGFGTRMIHSEYGMAELMSQAYLVGSYQSGNGLDTVFFTPPWMKVMVRNLQDPLSYNAIPSCGGGAAGCESGVVNGSGLSSQKGELGGINIIDLANVWSCSFIETEDVGRIVNTLSNNPCNSLLNCQPANSTSFTVEGRIKNSERRGCNMLIE